jgi:hemolysin activation/secretion protein
MSFIPRVVFFGRRALVAAGFCLLAGSALAQVSVDSEEQRRRAQQDAEERLRRQQAPDVRLQPPAPVVDVEALDLPSETPCFRIDRLRLDGERGDAFVWLETFLASHAGRCLGSQGINQEQTVFGDGRLVGVAFRGG